MNLFNKEGIEKIAESTKNRIGSDSKVGFFLKSMKNRMGIGSPERNATDTYERGMEIVPKCISANENEIPVKQYNIAVLRNLFKFERAEGRMQVTNKRVIFRAAGRSIGGRTTLQHEFAINEIAGIEARNNYKFSVIYLVFAILIISLAFYIINRPPEISGIMSPLRSQSSRISNIMFPKHIQKIYTEEKAAISQKKEAEENVNKIAEIVKKAQDKEKQAISYINRFGENRRIDIGYYNNYWINTSEYKAQCTAEKDKAEAEENEAVTVLETAKEKENSVIEKRVSAENVWKVLMTVLGFILGFAGLIPFFALYKKFGLKIFILIFSIFGFALSFAASGVRIFNWFYILSVLITFVCIFFFCFRPNLVISIKNKMGSKEGPVDIRCNENLNKLTNVLSFTIVFLPVAFFWCFNMLDSLSDSIVGPILSVVLPIILLIIIVLSIVRFLQNKDNNTGLDSGFAEVIPTEESESAIREIGAIIGDIQKLGDSALEKWAKR